jgi:hypothetical protein
MIGYLMSMTKYKHTIDTLDGPIEWEDETPPTIRRPEEIEEERARLYPTEDIASYLQYPCSYCQDKFYRYIPPRQEYEFERYDKKTMTGQMFFLSSLDSRLLGTHFHIELNKIK